MENNAGWESYFWKMVDEKGVGSDIRFAQACRDFIREQRQRDRKAVEKLCEGWALGDEFYEGIKKIFGDQSGKGGV